MAKLRIECKNCGKSFQAWRSDKRQYCSADCSGTRFTKGQSSWNKGTHIQTNSGKTHFKKGRSPHNKTEHIEKQCLQCGDSFRVPPCREQAKFCSHNCFATNRKETGCFKGRYTGTKRTDEQRARMSAAKLGVTLKEWSGFATDRRSREMSSLEYKSWRSAVFKRDNYTCQVCEQYSGTLHADHIERWADNEELRYAVDNGRTLCVPCHYYITFKRKMKPGTRWCNFTARERG